MPGAGIDLGFFCSGRYPSNIGKLKPSNAVRVVEQLKGDVLAMAIPLFIGLCGQSDAAMRACSSGAKAPIECRASPAVMPSLTKLVQHSPTIASRAAGVVLRVVPILDLLLARELQDHDAVG